MELYEHIFPNSKTLMLWHIRPLTGREDFCSPGMERVKQTLYGRIAAEIREVQER